MLTVFSLAFRNLWRHRRRTLITMSALVIGMTVVIFLAGFRNSFIKLIVDDAIRSEAGAFQVHRAGYMDSTDAAPLDLNLPVDAAMEAKILAVPGVAAVTPRVRFAGLVSSGSTSTMFIGTGIDPVREYTVCPDFRFRAVDANGATTTPIGPERADGILMGKELADGLKVKIGDTVTLLVKTAAGGMNALDATIVAYTLATNPFAGKRGIFVPLPFAQKLTGMEGKATDYVAAVGDPENVDAIAGAERTALGGTFEVQTWDVLAPFVKDAVTRLSYVLGIVGAVLLTIVITGIMNTVLMSVYERVREIGTMMALGMKRRAILGLFVAESLGMAATGAAVGVALGLGIVLWLNHAGIPISPPGGGMTASLRPFLHLQFVVSTVLVAFVGATVAAIYPAFKASRLRPVEALRAL